MTRATKKMASDVTARDPENDPQGGLPNAAPQQLPLALELRPALGRADFMVAKCNREAVAWIDHWPDWPVPALCLYGPRGSGKSHLAEVWRARSAARSVLGRDLVGANPDVLLGDAQGLVIEDADAGLDETVCFHLYNMLKERGGHMLMTAQQPPARWKVDLPDLKSRLGAALVCEISPPDDELMVGLLIKLFSDRQIPASPQIIAYILPRIERSFVALADLVAAIDRQALAEKRAVTLPLVRSVMDGQ
ncbi:HdaA/DnaA family protein [Thalassospira alkalitolerans]|uniref:HdaA/DnaA family protein n=1 Tax=Thalassospira alkalitolerans TaxID=1293890 RepID=UPI00111C5A68|nr:DnaA/Hda family protein [Thalassospira alkalitolerans]